MERKEIIKTVFGNHLQRLRNEKKLSMRGLASKAGLEYSQVQRIENGKVNVSISTIYALAEGLEIPASELLIPVKGL